MQADKGKEPPSAAKTLESQAAAGTGRTTGGVGDRGAEALMAHLLTKAKFEGGPWDAQEASAGEKCLRKCASARGCVYGHDFTLYCIYYGDIRDWWPRKRICMCSAHPPFSSCVEERSGRDLRACKMPGQRRCLVQRAYPAALARSLLRALTYMHARTHVTTHARYTLTAVAKAAPSIDDAAANSDDDFAPPAAAVSVPSPAPAAALSPSPASPQ
jgi:hypothetical protein